jgi:tryptophanyl-tRNA synthetase
MKTVLTCAQPTGTLTLGNYLGAVRNWATLLPGNECYFGIVDQHAITVDYTPSELRQNSLRCVAQYIACGLNPEEAHIFMQSHVIGHNELAWVLSCLTPVGDLLRMTQFKDKTGGFTSSQTTEGEGNWMPPTGSGKPQPKPIVNGGILFYPVLMAADVLLYNADIVPVGEDQKQHMELCRDLAQRFNHYYSDTFTVPDAYIAKAGARIMSLQEPTRKMSKSDLNDRATLFILDTPDQIKKKIMSAVTDSETEIVYDPARLGISNLLDIYGVLTGRTPLDIAADFEGKGYGYFKALLVDVTVESLAPIRQKFDELMGDKDYLIQVLKSGSDAAQKRAWKILSKVHRKVGFVEPLR